MAPIPHIANGENTFSADLEAYERLLASFSPTVVVNLIAISDPAVCEKDEEKAKRVNVPTALLKALASTCPDCFLVHLSTDQIYDGDVGAPHNETSEPRPINACVYTKHSNNTVIIYAPPRRYARTKLAAEKVVEEWPWHVILRSSAIYGPPAPRKCHRAGTFLQAAISMLVERKVCRHNATTPYQYLNHVCVHD